MRALLALLAVAAAPVWAACPVGFEVVESGSHTLSMKFGTDDAGSAALARVQYFAPTLHTDWEQRDQQVGFGSTTTRGRILYGLAAATAYFVDPQVTNAAGSVWGDYTSCQTELCPDGDGVQAGLGYSCAEVDASPACGGSACYAPTLTTAAAPGAYPVAPTAPTVTADPFTPPTVTGSTFNVDPSGDDLQAQINACETAAEADGLVHEIVIPAGAEARSELESLRGYTLPNLSDGKCWLRCGAAAKYLPPPGHAIHPGYARTGELCKITGNRAAVDLASTGGTRSIFKAGAGGASHWRIGPGIVIGLAKPSEITETAAAVTAFSSSDGTITSAGHGLGLNDLVQIELTGVEAVQAHRGGCWVWSPTTDTFKCLSMLGATGGSFTAGGWTADPSRMLTGCTSGGLCTLVGTHPFKNFHSYSVVSFSGSSLQLDDSTLQLAAGASIKVEGSTGCDGVYGIASFTSDTVTLDQSTGGSCSDGTARQVGMGLLGGTDTVAAHDAYLVEFPDATHVQLLDPALPGATTGGWFSYDPPMPNQGLVSISSDSTDIIFDRVIVDAPDPWRLRGGISGTDLSQVAIVGSYGAGLMPWVGVDPNTGHGNAQTGGTVSNAAGTFFASHRGSDVRFERNRTSNTGYAMFSDNLAGAHPANWLIQAVEDWKGPRMIPGRAEAKNVGRLLPNAYEWKKGENIEMNGFALFGGGSVRQPSGAPILFSYTPFSDGQRMESFALRNGQIQAASCIEIVGGEREFGVYPIRKIAIENILCDAQRSPVGEADTLIGAPGSQLLEAPGGLGSNGSGFFLRFTGGEDLLVDHVTARVRGNFPLTLWLGGRRHHSVHALNSIFLASSESGNGDIDGDGNNWSTVLPALSSSTGWTLWRDGVQEGPGDPDPNSEMDAKWVPVSQNPTATAWRTTSNSYRAALVTRLDCSGEAGGCPDNFTVEVAGSDPATGATREEAVFAAGRWERDPGVYAGYGHDQDALEDALLRIRGLSAAGITGGVRLSYTAPSGVTCSYQSTSATTTVGATAIPDWTGASDWAADAGGSASRTTDATGLSTGTVYWFRLSCGLHEALVRGRAL